jgi:hypothetical protein
MRLFPSSTMFRDLIRTNRGGALGFSLVADKAKPQYLSALLESNERGSAPSCLEARLSQSLKG